MVWRRSGRGLMSQVVSGMSHVQIPGLTWTSQDISCVSK